jgi:hypothetical protein
MSTPYAWLFLGSRRGLTISIWSHFI